MLLPPGEEQGYLLYLSGFDDTDKGFIRF